MLCAQVFILSHLLTVAMAKNVGTQVSESRGPASFIPDDQTIIKPSRARAHWENVYEEFQQDHAGIFNSSRNQIRQWVLDQQYADEYGMHVLYPEQMQTQEIREQFFERNFLRFIQRDLNRVGQRDLRQWWEGTRAGEEISVVEESERQEQYIILAKAKAESTDSAVVAELNTGNKAKESKKTFKFRFRPRLELGYARFSLESAYINIQGRVGVNGRTELRAQRHFATTGGNAQVDYFLEQRRMIASYDQPLNKNTRLRIAHDRTEIESGPAFEDNSLQVNYWLSF